MKYFLLVSVLFLIGCQNTDTYQYNTCNFSNSNDSVFKAILPDTNFDYPDKFTIKIIDELKFNNLASEKKSDFYGFCKAKKHTEDKIYNLILFVKKPADRISPASHQPYDFVFFNSYKEIECREFISSFPVKEMIDSRYPLLIGELSFVVDCNSSI